MKYSILITFILLCFANILFSQEYKDCADALIICDKSTLRMETTDGIGESESLGINSCIPIESSSLWLRFNIKSAGDLIFELKPDNEATDLDFIVFQIENDNCDSKVLVRCMASGETLGQPSSSCFGSTGLAFGEIDTIESPGCSAGDNNFLAPLIVEENDQFAVLINDFSTVSDSIEISFGGSATLGCNPSSIITQTKNNSHFNISSNIYSDELFIDFNQSIDNGNLSIYDFSGNLVYNRKLNGNDPIQINERTITSAYFIVLQTKDFVESKKVFFIR